MVGGCGRPINIIFARRGVCVCLYGVNSCTGGAPSLYGFCYLCVFPPILVCQGILLFSCVSVVAVLVSGLSLPMYGTVSHGPAPRGNPDTSTLLSLQAN